MDVKPFMVRQAHHERLKLMALTLRRGSLSVDVLRFLPQERLSRVPTLGAWGRSILEKGQHENPDSSLLLPGHLLPATSEAI